MNIQQLKNLILTKIDNRNDFNNLFTRDMLIKTKIIGHYFKECLEFRTVLKVL